MTPRFALLTAAVGAMLLTALLGIVFVPLLRRMGCQQPIKTQGPAWHAKKAGTPTMGGLMLMLGSLLAVLAAYLPIHMQTAEMSGSAWQQSTRGLALAAGYAAANGAVGFADDCIKVFRKDNRGLPAWAKLLVQLVLAAGLLAALQIMGALSTLVQLPGIGWVDLGWAFYPLSYLLMVGITNAVNLTDGVDGLAGGVTFMVMLGFLALTSLLGWFDLSLFAGALAGACAGFLAWNFPPARIFMGDTGSLYLGGAVVALAYCMGRPELLLVLGLVYIVEAASVLLQLAWFRITKGKRLLKMSPLHHHLELCGWSESRITCVFSAAALVCVGLTFVFVYMG